MMASIDSMNFMMKILRCLIFGLNISVIVLCLYFSISHCDLHGHQLDTKPIVIITLSLSCSVISLIGIIASLYNGANKSLHMSVTLIHVILLMTAMIIGGFLGFVFQSKPKPNSADVLFTMLSIVTAIMMLKSSLIFAILIKRSIKIDSETKTLE